MNNVRRTISSKGEEIMTSNAITGCIPLEVEETQEIALEILDKLDQFCKERGITYFLIGGSLIGAVRSHNLVPWDDDIDVAMKRADYERFCLEFNDDERFMLCTYARCKHYRRGIAKLIRKGTLFVEPVAKDDPTGVFVDIFPLDSVPSADDAFVTRTLLRVKVYFYSFVFNSEFTKNNVLKSAIRKLLSASIGRGSYLKALESLNKRMASGKGDYLINFWGTWGRKECVPKDCFDSTVPVLLRGKEYPAPIGYHEWLSRVYGNYMTPPSDPPSYHGHAFRV